MDGFGSWLALSSSRDQLSGPFLWFSGCVLCERSERIHDLIHQMKSSVVKVCSPVVCWIQCSNESLRCKFNFLFFFAVIISYCSLIYEKLVLDVCVWSIYAGYMLKVAHVLNWLNSEYCDVQAGQHCRVQSALQFSLSSLWNIDANSELVSSFSPEFDEWSLDMSLTCQPQSYWSHGIFSRQYYVRCGLLLLGVR